MIEGLKTLLSWDGKGGYISSAPKEAGGNYMAAGSSNAVITGAGKVSNFKGNTIRAGKGGFVMNNVAETFASVGQTSDGTAYGNVMNVFAALFYIGKGLVRLAGTSFTPPIFASATLSLLIKRAGSYNGPTSGPYQAGLAEPSAPIITAITPPAGFTGKVNGTVSVVIWRARLTTGAVSNKSPVSNIVTASNQSIAIQFPLPDANGQDAWGIGVTKNIEGRTGSHFELTVINEADLVTSLTRTDVVTDSTDVISSATGGFTSAHIGWTVTLSGGSPACVLSSYVIAVPSPTTLKLAAAAPTTSTGVQMTLANGVGGSARSAVVEWRDGDLIGKPFAPKRSFRPPSGLFAGTLGPFMFVDGAYADANTTVVPSSSSPGTGLAPSEPGRPESFSPDKVIFTSDSPTALMRGDGLYWRWGRNSLHTIENLGDSISMEIVWEGTGIQFQNQACLGEGGRLYFWPANRGLMRMGQDGLPEGGWAVDISDDLIGCTDASKRVLGWDGISQVIAVCYENRIWPFFSSLGIWGAPLTVSTPIRSAITENNQLILCDTNDDLWTFGTGNGTTMVVRTPWMPSGSLDTVAAIVASVRADNTSPVTVKTYADGEETVLDTTAITPRVGFQRLPAVWPNVTNCQSHSLELTMTSTSPTSDAGIESLNSLGESDNNL